MVRAGAEAARREPFASWLSGNLREGGMDPVLAGQPGREHPLARYLDDFLADLANAGASRHTLCAYRGDLLQFAGVPRRRDRRADRRPGARVSRRDAGAGGGAPQARRGGFLLPLGRPPRPAGRQSMDKIDTVKVRRRLPRPAAPPTSPGCSPRSAAGGRARTSRWTGCATGCCSRPRTRDVGKNHAMNTASVSTLLDSACRTGCVHEDR
jgi:hypothetical protein